MPVEQLSFGDLHIEGVSRAGDETWVRVRPPGLVFDTGRGALQLGGAQDVFLTHGHLDHALGLPFLLSLRTVHQEGLTRVFAPAAITDDLRALIAAAESLEGTQYAFEMRGLRPGDRIPVGKDLVVEAFATDHNVPSLGFHLLRTRKRLKRQFEGRSGRELAALKSAGTQVVDMSTEIWLSYSGDTGPGVFDREPRILGALVLMIECTFFDEASRERARQFKHLHLADLVERAAEFKNRELVLQHTSRRYTRKDLAPLVAERLCLETTRVHLFGC